MAGVSPARRAAARALLAVEVHGAHADDVLRGAGLDAPGTADAADADAAGVLEGPAAADARDRRAVQDRRLAMALVMGCLRWQLWLDAAIAALLRRPGARLDPPVRIALRLGLLQLAAMDRVPARAAISESVELAKAAGHRYAAGMVNAVLRRAAAQAPRLPPLAAGSAEDLARTTSHPLWMVERWAQAFGLERAARICAANQQEPPLCLRLAGDEEPADACLEPGLLLRRARRSREPLADAGRFPGLRAQDEGSQLVAELAGRGSSILDCCAAPGGKTAILAARNPGASILAVEISPRRMAAMRQSLGARDGLDFLEADVCGLQAGERFDLVLCDAPCSGTGTIARNPEIRYRLRPADLLRQQQRQVAILSSAMRCLAPGGRLVYSTCSLESEENQDVVRLALAASSGFRTLPVGQRLAELEQQGALAPGGLAALVPGALEGDFLQTLGGVQPCDGFFAAILTRG